MIWWSGQSFGGVVGRVSDHLMVWWSSCIFGGSVGCSEDC